jgi:hypothetical protein
MHNFITITLIFTSLFLTAQTTADFENFNLQAESFLNGSDGNGGFSSGNVFLPNAYDDSFGSWTGWSISNTINTTTPGFTNQYSAITGGGENSETYATAYTGGGRINIALENAATGEKVNGFYITNSTYAALSMQEGDSFAKKFGGLAGNDPDYFLLTIKKYENDELSTDSVDVYLADYRFEDNSEDYILDEWTYVDLTSLGNVDSLQFFLSSTDNGIFGMNTPAYFCIDDFTTSDGITSVENVEEEVGFTIFPNPASDFINIKNKVAGDANYSIYDKLGRVVETGSFSNEGRVNTSFLAKGMYVMRVKQNGLFQSQIFVKQ